VVARDAFHAGSLFQAESLEIRRHVTVTGRHGQPRAIEIRSSSEGGDGASPLPRKESSAEFWLGG